MKTAKFLCAAALAALTALVSCEKDPDIPEPLVKSFGFYASDNSGRIDSDCVGTVSGTDITVGVPPTTDLSELVARFTTNEGNVVSVGGVALISGQTVQDYSSPVSLKVEDEELKASVLYTVKVSLNPDSDPKLTSFKFELVNNLEAIGEDIEGEISGDAISVPMIKAADKTKLVATFTTTPTNVVKVGDVVQVSGETANDFTNPVDYIVTNSDGSKSALYSVSIKTVNGKLEPLVTYSERPLYSGAVLRINPVDKAPYIGFKEREVKDSESASAEKMTVVKYADGAWSTVGSAGFSKEVSSDYYDFDITDAGSFYVAYVNAGSSTQNVQVMTFANNKWEVVGQDETSDVQSRNVTLSAISDKNIVVLQTNNNRNHELGRYTLVASVFNGSWTSGVTAPFEKSQCAYIAGDKAGDTAYFLVIRKSFEGVDYGHDVVAYTNGNWSSLRTNYVREGATRTGIYFYDIVATEDGSVYLLTIDNSLTKDIKKGNMIVEKYSPNSKEWTTIGGTHYGYVVADSHDRAKIAVAPDGTPYLLYYDSVNDILRLTWLDSETKQWADPIVVATEALSDINIAFASSGVGYIAFTDANNAEKVFIYR